MRQGSWNFELLSKCAKMIDTCVYQGKRYALYLDCTQDDSNILILVSITDMWYVYVDNYLLEHIEIVDDLIFKLGREYDVTMLF